jgi:dolichol-phosphate mannosyltransferase
MNKIIAMIPTYNEGGHIRDLIDEILAQDPRMEVLVVDDDSPDGTWQVVGDVAGQDPRVHLLRRTRGRGRGASGIDGFQRALDLGADAVIEMDGDFSHDPRDIPRFIQAIGAADLVVGSRAVAGGEDFRSARCRNWMTRLAAGYIRWVLGLGVKDPTSGYRCFRKETLDGIGLHAMRSRGPSIVEEVLHACHRRGFRIREIPIRFNERRSGESKLTARTLVDTAWFVARLRWSGR